jgi:hypothetical protein
MKTLTLTILALLLISASSFAVPTLQLYSPDAVYNSATESWQIFASDFELWVVAANLQKNDIYNITLVAALAQDDTPADGALTIDGNTFNAADFEYGTPPDVDPLPPHGVYPTNYAEFLVASVTTAGPFVEVPDYSPDVAPGSSLYGQVFKFNVTTSYEFVQFDAYGFEGAPDGKRIKAPFSHDAHTGAVPEPTTLALFGLGLAAAGFMRKKRG